MLYYIVAILLVIIGIAHSYLGERYILTRLFKRDNLPHLYGSDEFTKNTLRFAWHLTTIAWWGFAAILAHMAQGEITAHAVNLIIAITFLLHAAASIVGAKGKHFSWTFFLAIGLIALYLSLN